MGLRTPAMIPRRGGETQNEWGSFLLMGLGVAATLVGSGCIVWLVVVLGMFYNH